MRFLRRSTLYFASQPADLRDLRNEYECRRHFGFDLEFWDRPHLQARSSIDAAGAIYSASDGQIDPFRLTRRLIERATSDGMRAFAKTCVRNVDRQGERLVLATDRARVTARAVVYAAGYEAGPFSSADIGTLHSTYALASQPLPTSPGWPDDCLIWETARPYFYARKTLDGRAIIGGADTARSDDHEEASLLEQKADELLQRFRRLFPSIEFVPDSVWAGTFGETRDGLAFIGTRPAVRTNTSPRIRRKRNHVQPDRRPFDRRPVFRATERGRGCFSLRALIRRGCLGGVFLTGACLTGTSSSGDSAGPARTSPVRRNREP